MEGFKVKTVLIRDILNDLDCPLHAPTLRYLNRLIYSYLCRVPWESVSRIFRRHTTASTSDCPRWPEEFWHDSIRYGFGGTCFESSLAFYSLLMALGYEGYLTVNDMGDSRGCHAAIVLLFDGQKYLVDITIPLHAAVRVDPEKVVKRHTSFYDYTIRPVQENKYEVELSGHPSRYAFTLIDVPVSLPDYQAIVKDDYQELTGRFLKSVVIVKFIDGRTQRFFSDHRPYKLESFDRTGKLETLIEPQVLPQTLAKLFQMPEESISAALAWIQSSPAEVNLSLLQERNAP